MKLVKTTEMADLYEKLLSKFDQMSYIPKSYP